MEKTLLRSIIVGLTPGQQINITFRGALAAQTGLYETVLTKRGRGKGGSQLAELTPVEIGENDDDGIVQRIGDNITIGTPKNDDILNVTLNGETFGYSDESEVPANYETDAANAGILKEQFKGLMNAAETRPLVAVDAPGAPEVNGNFTVVDARQLRGRAGQVVLVLQAADSEKTQELWSYRHSGVVQSFKVVGP